MITNSRQKIKQFYEKEGKAIVYYLVLWQAMFASSSKNVH